MTTLLFRSRPRALLAGGLALVAGFLACDSSPTAIDPESQAATLTIEASATTIPVQGEAALSAVLRNRAGNELDARDIRWGTHTPSLVAVDSIGRTAKVRGLSPGTARVWASSSGVDAEVSIVVTGSAERVEVTPATHSMPLGTSQQFQALVRDAQGNPLPNPAVAWSTTSASILTVSPTGVVSAAGIGTAQVTATINGRSGSAQVTVTPTAVATVSVAPDPGEVTLGRTIQLFPTLKDAAGNVLAGRAVAWQSSNPAVLEISASGLGTGHALGTATVTATSEGKSGTTQVSVVPQSTLLIEVFPASTAINPGDSVRFSAVARNSSGAVVTGLPVSWASSDPAVATMTGLGMATGVNPGVTTITAIVDGRSGSTQLSVRSPAPQITNLSPDTVTAGRTSDLVLTVTGSGFTPASRVRLNGTDRPTAYQSATLLRATLTPADLEEARTVPVTVHTPPPGGGTTTPLSFQVKPRNGNVVGDTVRDEIHPAGDIDEIRFDGQAGQEINVYFQALSGAENQHLLLFLYDPQGQQLGSMSSEGTDQTLEGQGFGSIRLPRDGSYILRVRGYNGTEQGPYRIYVMPIALGPERIGRAVTVGSVISGEEIDPVGDIDEFTFTGTKGQFVNVFFQATSGSASDRLWVSLLTPGRDNLESIYSDGTDRVLDGRSTGRMELPQTGTYTLRVEGANVMEDEGGYRLQVVLLNNAPESLPATVTQGPVVSGESISPRGDVDYFTFAGTAGEEVFVFFQATSGESGSEFLLTLYAPDGDQLEHTSSRGSDVTLEGQGFGPVRLAQTGSYTIRVRGYQGVEQGPYRFQVLPVRVQPEQIAAAVTVGPLVTGESLSSVADVDHFTFTGMRGQAINLMFQATSGLYDDVLYLELRNPAGQRLTYLTSRGSAPSLEGQQTGRITLTQDGTYVVRVQAWEWGSQGPYRFRIVPLQ
ncbi:MAG TPA: Ig-like domain-containing protein [Longimicrobium sp.]|nr:Ig-like domain-containing protein [Longimicrobium sp.]